MNRKTLLRIALISGAIVLVAGGALAIKQLAGIDNEALGEVRREDLVIEVEASGRFEAEVAFDIGPPSVANEWDYQLSWLIPEASRVKAGDVIARFDASEIEDRLTEHRAELQTAIEEKEKEQRSLALEISKLDLDLVKARGALERVDVEVALPDGMVSTLEMRETELERDMARQRVEFLTHKIEFSKALVRSRLELLDVKRAFAEGRIAYGEEAKAKYEVKAPVAGLVVHVPKQRGERWEVGESVWMLAKILKVADITTLRVEAHVLEADAAQVAPGQPAVVRVDAVPGLEIGTGVAEIGRLVHEKSPQDPSKVFDVILPLDRATLPADKLDALRPGMGVTVKVQVRRIEDQLTVPIGAVGLSADGPFVQVSAGRGDFERRKVTLGERNRERVAVLSGLVEGESVRLPRRASS